MASRGDDPAIRVLNYIEQEGLSSEAITITVAHSPDDPDFGQEVSVILNYNLGDGTVLPWDHILPNGLNAAAYARME